MWGGGYYDTRRQDQWRRREEEIRRQERQQRDQITGHYHGEIQAKENVLKLTKSLLTVSRSREETTNSNAGTSSAVGANKRARVDEDAATNARYNS
ncbi:expressed unknown protein [Seminavis robusta]|uniref:Uncharacterized protein n=1 Tax=Seminavis robusta TaxID=568900 RepID=A0A9N8EFQ8_9STRA|nr:expressed unknown protein [Seminavis robusta]|eukprot:Sro923_g220780.1 n/a (96) ;mRNA; f:37069-37356